jgi:hypothetical protein
MSKTYPTIGWVPEPWQPSPIGYILPTSNISDNQNQHIWIRNLRAKTQRFDDPRCFEAYKMSGRQQGMFFRLCTCFLDNLVEFHSRDKEVLQTTRG